MAARLWAATPPQSAQSTAQSTARFCQQHGGTCIDWDALLEIDQAQLVSASLDTKCKVICKLKQVLQYMLTSAHSRQPCWCLQRSGHDTTVLEGIIDSLLSNITAVDTFSLSMHHYMHFMHLLQCALQCIWSLHSRDAQTLAATKAASQAAFGFTGALRVYVKAVHADLNAVANGVLSTTGPVSEPLRIKLRPVKKMADSAWKKLQASHSERVIY